MTRIEWTRTEPGDIEHLVAMLLCRENPAATHIRPSRGDGGIDVLVPADDGSGIIVYQVKSFHSNLTASQKAQVERSFHRLVDFAKAHDLKVLEWYLTLPLDPTTENLLDWLADLTAGHDLTVGWRGLNFLVGYRCPSRAEPDGPEHGRYPQRHAPRNPPVCRVCPPLRSGRVRW